MSADIFKNRIFQNCQAPPPGGGMKYYGAPQIVMPLRALLAVSQIVTRPKAEQAWPARIIGFWWYELLGF